MTFVQGICLGILVGTLMFGFPLLNYNLGRIATQLELIAKSR